MEAAVPAQKLPRATSTPVDTPAPVARPSSSHATLLGLPPELRFMIYDMVADFDICHPAFDHEMYPSKVLRWDAFLLPQPRRSTPIRLPIARLAMTCKLLATEVRRHSHSLLASQRFAVVRVTSSLEAKSPDLLHFHRAPCPIDDLAAVKVVVDLKVGNFDLDLDDPLDRPASQSLPMLKTCARHLRTQLMYLLHPASTFGVASAIKSVQIYIHVERLPSNGHSKKTYDTLVRYIRKAYTKELDPDCLYSIVVRGRTTSVEGFSSDAWVERAGEVKRVAER